MRKETRRDSKNYVCKWIRPEKRERIYARDKYTCVYCGKPFENGSRIAELTLDHVRPKELGGTNDPCNLVTACKSCNCAKRDLALHKYLCVLETEGYNILAVARNVRNARRRKLPKGV